MSGTVERKAFEPRTDVGRLTDVCPREGRRLEVSAHGRAPTPTIWGCEATERVTRAEAAGRAAHGERSRRSTEGS